MVDDTPFTGVLRACDKAGSRGWEVCRVTSVGRGQQLPHAGHSQLQQTHCRAPLSHGWDASEKAYLRKGRKGRTETRREQKEWDSRGNTTIRGGGEEGAPGT